LSEVKKGPISISRKKLDVEAIRKAETGGPDYVPSFYRPPTVTLGKKRTMRFLCFRAYINIKSSSLYIRCRNGTCIL